MPMTHTQKTLEQSWYWLGKAKAYANEYEEFANNKDSFVTKLNSVMDIMINEFGGVPTFSEWHAEEGNTIAEATRNRDALIQTLGNLTILVQPLNSAVSNSSWQVKKPKLLASSLLPINQHLFQYDNWDEGTIQKRGREPFQRAKALWPGPTSG
jgi:hypothetical protein